MLRNALQASKKVHLCKSDIHLNIYRNFFFQEILKFIHIGAYKYLLDERRIENEIHRKNCNLSMTNPFDIFLIVLKLLQR